MVRDTRIIRPLAADVAAQIKSSISIISLSYVVLGLIENALDAEATEIVVTVDFGRGACSIEDNGTGIAPTDFAATGGLGKQYRTCKLPSQLISSYLRETDTAYTGDSTNRFGRNGTFLSSLAALAILTITSRHISYNSTSTIIYHHSRAAARLIPAPVHHQLNVRSHGTRVQVQDLFGNMPVRVKQRPATDSNRRYRDKEWEWLRKNITGLLLAWDSPICLTVQGFDKDHILRFKSPVLSSILLETMSKPNIPAKSFNLDFIRNTLHSGAAIDLGDWKTWVKTSARTPFLTLRGIISLEPAPSKETQFISLGLRYLTQDNECNILYDHVNALFASSAFGVQEELGHAGEEVTGREGTKQHLKRDGLTQKQLKGGGKGVDRWPMFFIRIDSNAENSISWQSELNSMEQMNCLSSIIKVLEAMILGYLSEHHLRPRIPRTKKPKVPSTERSRPAHQRSLTSFMSYQSRYNMAGVTIVESPLSIPRTLRSVTASPGDLVDNAILPKFLRSKSDGSRADFSGWSRIKGSLKEDLSIARRGPNMIMPASVSPQRSDIVQNLKEDQDTLSCCSMAKPSILFPGPESLILDHRTDTVPATTDFVLGPADTTHIELGSCPHDSDCTESGDMILTWTNPISNANVQINSRTGSIVEDQYESRLRGPSADRDVRASSCRSKTDLKRLPSATLSTVKPPSKLPDGSWAEIFLKSWENPIFRRTEEAIPRVSEQLTEVGGGRGSPHGNDHFSYGSSERAFMNSSISFPARLTKHDLRNAEVIAQLDKKFILTKVALKRSAHVGDETRLDGNHLLVLIDQHAADERIRIETLLAEFCVKASPTSTELVSNQGLRSAVETTRLSKPISFPVKARELGLFEHNALHFAKWGILYNVDRTLLDHHRGNLNHEAIIVVLTLPAAIAERCRVDVKHLVELLRGEVWKREEAGFQESLPVDSPCINKPDRSHPLGEARIQESWPELIHDCPQGILDMLNSRACRSAIMFNDELTFGECERLTKRLAACFFPFQCAHGRPSMVPLVNLDDKDFVHSTLLMENREQFGRGTVDFREAWMKSMAH
ncbi:DNA mismatch repair protein [Xylographa bjoerkii]|nr:DNA mismatch repair protein [Xylographa bjoerkii]